MKFYVYFLFSQFILIQSLNLSDNKFILTKTKKLIATLTCYTCGLLVNTNNVCFADDALFNPSLQGIVTIQKDLSPVNNEISALYITAREDSNFFKSGVLNNKPPPVLAKRIAGPITFPIQFSLDYNQDVTPEGALPPKLWTNKKNILVSVRLDTDGIAATRDDTDLIGKDVAKYTDTVGIWSTLHIELTDRGIGGKFVTRKN